MWQTKKVEVHELRFSYGKENEMHFMHVGADKISKLFRRYVLQMG